MRLGYRVIVPDMLGYGGTDKPEDAAEYAMRKLSDDLAALLDALGVPEDCRTWAHADLARALPCTGVRSGVILFPKAKPAAAQRES